MEKNIKNIENVVLPQIDKTVDDIKKQSETLNEVLNALYKQLNNYYRYDILQEELYSFLALDSKINKYARIMNIENEEKTFNAYRLGLAKSLINLIKCKNQKQRSEYDNLFSAIKSIKHFPELLVIIFNNEGLNHTDLAKKLNISKTALSNLIQKVEEYELFSTERHGKCKLYFSNYKTRLAIEYYQSPCESRYDKKDVYNIIILIFTELANSFEETNINFNRLSALIDTFFEGETPNSVQKSCKRLENVLTIKKQMVYRNFTNEWKAFQDDDLFDYDKITRINTTSGLSNIRKFSLGE